MFLFFLDAFKKKPVFGSNFENKTSIPITPVCQFWKNVNQSMNESIIYIAIFRIRGPAKALLFYKTKFNV